MLVQVKSRRREEEGVEPVLVVPLAQLDLWDRRFAGDVLEDGGKVLAAPQQHNLRVVDLVLEGEEMERGHRRQHVVDDEVAEVVTDSHEVEEVHSVGAVWRRASRMELHPWRVPGLGFQSFVNWFGV